MEDQYSRSRLLFGPAGLERLRRARVAVFGVGGVGGYVVEALARGGVGALELVDNDVFTLSNLNRQLYATLDTIGRPKVEVAAERIARIDQTLKVTPRRCFFLPETAAEFDFSRYDYVVDAIDTVSGKLELVERAVRAGVPVISAMGAGNKMDPSAFEVADISQTSVDPLARVMRRELKKRGIFHLKVVYSREPPLAPLPEETQAGDAAEEARSAPVRRAVPGSNSFVPAAAGLVLAGEVIRELSGFREDPGAAKPAHR